MSLTTSELSDSELSTRAIITSGASKRKRRGPNRPPVITGPVSYTHLTLPTKRIV